MNRKILVIDNSDNGHHLEYIHHLYEAATKIDDGTQYVFAVPETFSQRGKLLKWSNSPNVSFYYLSSAKCKVGIGLMSNIKRSLVARDVIKEIKPSDVVFITLMAYVPFISFFIPRNVKVSGIIYKVYLYSWRDSKWLSRLKQVICYSMMSKLSHYRNLFVLNDDSSTRILNRIWKTEKFKYLPDPLAIDVKLENLTRPSDLPQEGSKTIFLHAGGMDYRKGTMMVFEIISRLSQEQREKMCFVFAGTVKDTLREKFYDAYNKLKNNCEIIVYDEFCSYELLASLCKYSDYLLLPYKNTDMSSGIIAYGAYCGTPVIVPNGGLLGKLVKRHKMGIGIKDNFVDSFLLQVDELCKDHQLSHSDYVETHTINAFTNVLKNIS